MQPYSANGGPQLGVSQAPTANMPANASQVLQPLPTSVLLLLTGILSNKVVLTLGSADWGRRLEVSAEHPCPAAGLGTGGRHIAAAAATAGKEVVRSRGVSATAAPAADPSGAGQQQAGACGAHPPAEPAAADGGAPGVHTGCSNRLRLPTDMVSLCMACSGDASIRA